MVIRDIDVALAQNTLFNVRCIRTMNVKPFAAAVSVVLMHTPKIWQALALINKSDVVGRGLLYRLYCLFEEAKKDRATFFAKAYFESIAGFESIDDLIQGIVEALNSNAFLIRKKAVNRCRCPEASLSANEYAINLVVSDALLIRSLHLMLEVAKRAAPAWIICATCNTAKLMANEYDPQSDELMITFERLVL